MSVVASFLELRLRRPELAAEARSRGAEFKAARRIAPKPGPVHTTRVLAPVARRLVPPASGGMGQRPRRQLIGPDLRPD
jgi:hypothetical protein